MLEAEIWGIAETGDGYMIFIKPLQSEYSVPIFIGQLEAQAILIGFGGISISRPLTADLLQSLIKEVDWALKRTEINDLKDNTFFGRLVLKKPLGGELVLDSRPSDALALAVRCKCPIYIAEKVVKEAGIPVESLNSLVIEPSRAGENSGETADSAKKPAAPETTPETTEDAKKRLLKAELDEAVAAENYERAAEIRDMLNLMEK